MKKIINKFRKQNQIQPVPNNMVSMLHGIKLHDGVTHAHLAWTNLPTMPSTVQAVSYLYGNYKTRDQALAAADHFSNTLPSAASPVHEERHLWAMVEPISGVTFTPESKLIDLTESTKIQHVRTLVDALPEFAKTDLSFVAAMGVIDNINAPKLSFEYVQKHPMGTKLVYQFRNWEWKDWEAFSAQIALLRDITKADLETLRVRLHVTDGMKFTLKDDKRTHIKTVMIDYRTPQSAKGVAPVKKEMIERVAKPQRKNQIPTSKGTEAVKPMGSKATAVQPQTKQVLRPSTPPGRNFPMVVEKAKDKPRPAVTKKAAPKSSAKVAPAPKKAAQIKAAPKKVAAVKAKAPVAKAKSVKPKAAAPKSRKK